jgi:eukaryotic-like serine/threonine-protein kinase
MALRTRVWSAGKLVLLGVALLVTYVLFAAGAMRVALRSREVLVPDLLNQTAAEATDTMTQVGLSLRVDETRRLDPKIPANRIVAQDPPGGATLRSQRNVRVWLSAGPRATAVPSVTGQTERSAEQRLLQDGLAVAAISEIRTQTYAPDVVVAQDPEPRTPAERVALLISRPESGAGYVMPDLIGVNGDRAAEILRRHGFRVAVVGSMPYPGVAAGVVLRQNPQAGFEIAPGEPISIEVSR